MKRYRAMRTNKPQSRAAASVDIKPKKRHKRAHSMCFQLNKVQKQGLWS